MLDVLIKVVRFRARFYRGTKFGLKLKFSCAESCWSLLSKKKLKSAPMLIAEISLSENAERLTCISTPDLAGDSKELTAISLGNITPFDYTKIAVATAKEVKRRSLQRE